MVAFTAQVGSINGGLGYLGQTSAVERSRCGVDVAVGDIWENRMLKISGLLRGRVPRSNFKLRLTLTSGNK